MGLWCRLFKCTHKSPFLTHEVPGPRYVVNGKVRVEDSGDSHVYAGEVFWETGAAMTIENVGASNAEILIFQLPPTKAGK